MNKKEKLELNTLYTQLKEKQMSSGDCVENYTNGYKFGHTNGQIELLEKLLKLDIGLRSNDK